MNVEYITGSVPLMQHWALILLPCFFLALTMGECDSTFLKSRTPRITVLDNYWWEFFLYRCQTAHHKLTIRELTLLWYSRIYFCILCIRPKKSKNDSWHWIEIYRRIAIVESSINGSSRRDCQAVYYWFFLIILHRKSNHQLCVKDFTEEGLDGSLHNLKKSGELI